jgi:diguanylate cyclase (GGDEF)-like protein
MTARADRLLASMSARERIPRLVLRFAVFTALGLAAAAAIILIVVRQADTAEVERQAIGRARLATEAALNRELRAADLAAPVDVKRRRTLDRLFRTRVLLEGIRSATLYGPDGSVAYTTRPGGGVRTDEPALRRALAGTVVANIAEGGSGRVLRTYVPISIGGPRPNGAVALDQDFGRIEAAARRSSWVIAGVLEALLLVLSLIFVPTLARVTSRIRRNVADLEYIATHDELTGLLNRLGFRKAVEQCLADREPRGAVILIDLDGFSEINDVLGSERGDAVLSEVAERLGRDLDENVSLARLGEDEFGLVLNATYRAEIAVVGERVRQSLGEPLVIGGVRIAMTVSIGAAVLGEHGTEFAVVLRRAGAALSAAKEHGQASLEIYDPELEADDASRLALVAELREALTDDQLLVHYQPLVDLSTRSVRGVESLVRWQHPEHGLLSAGAFIGQAERGGLSREIRRFVLQRTMQQWREWKDRGIDLELAVNLGTADMLDVSLPDEIEALLQEHGVPAWNLVLEITERTLIGDERRAGQVIGRLNGLGVRLAIDDFGTGYSSLASLLRFPVQQVKLDQSLLSGVPGDPAAEAVLVASVDIAHALGATVVAEGVETGDQWRYIASIGCDIAQGYLIGPALPPHELAAFVQPDPAVTPQIAA